MSKPIKIDLFSLKSINEAKKQLEEYQNSLPQKCEELVRRLSEKGVEIAQANIVSLDAVFTGDLFNSIHSEKRGNGVYAVVADSEHAIFVELGTGVVGKETPYPYELPEGVTWEYASGKTIRQLADGRYGWFYPGNDGQWYFTEGMPSRPFMHFTTIELMNRVVETVREVFANG